MVNFDATPSITCVQYKTAKKTVLANQLAGHTMRHSEGVFLRR